MYDTNRQNIIIFIIVCTLLILLLILFIIIIVYKYQQRQNIFFRDLEKLKIIHENNMLQSMLEIQEQTFTNVSREIHDNIGQKLTLAKLHLNTLNFPSNTFNLQIVDIIAMIGEAINDLSDISRSMSSEMILNNGLIKALEFEISQLNKPGLYNIKLSVTGEAVFLDANKELVLFRIIQEALNNIVKHAEASNICIELYYSMATLILTINDNGKGFKIGIDSLGSGLNNMSKRAKMLNGSCDVNSEKGLGTTIQIEIPLYENNDNL